MKQIRFFAVVFCAVVFVGASGVDLNNRGVALLNEGRFEQAVETLGSAYRAQPNDDVIRKNYALSLNNWGIALSRDGQYEKAEKTLLEGYRVAADEGDIGKNLAVVRSNWAIALSQAGKYDDAERLFKRAYDTVPRSGRGEIDAARAENLVQIARRERERGLDANAKRTLKQALELNPDSPSALMDYGQMLYDEGDSRAALAYWERVIELKPGVQGLSERLEKLRREVAAEEGFASKTTRHFIISYSGAENARAARVVLDILDEAYRDVGQAMRITPKRRIQVVLYTKAQFDSVTMAPHWSGAVYDGKIRVPWSDRFFNDRQRRQLREMLFHEYAHAAAMDLSGPLVPSWLNEGLATYFELEPREREARYAREWERVARWLREGKLPAIKNLPKSFTSIRDERRAQSAYLISRTFVTWLAGPTRAHRFNVALEAIGEGATIDEALEKAFHKTLDELDAAWRRDLGGGR